MRQLLQDRPGNVLESDPFGTLVEISVEKDF